MYTRDNLGYLFCRQHPLNQSVFKGSINTEVDKVPRLTLVEDHDAIGKSVKHVFKQGTI